MQPFSGRGVFYLLRHGATDWNLDGRLMGRRAVPLNTAGRRQIDALRPQLAGLGIEQVWTSPLARARASAEIAAGPLDLPIREDGGLTEVEYGAWEGLTYAEISQAPAFRELLADPARFAAPGGGESLLDVRERVYRAMERIALAADGRPVLVVSHGDPLRLVLAGCLGVAVEQVRRLRIDTGGLSAIELTGDWAEVKFVNLRPDLASGADAGARASSPEGEAAGDPAGAPRRAT